MLAQASHDLGARDAETQRSALHFLAGRRSGWLVEALGLEPDDVTERMRERLVEAVGEEEAEKLWRRAAGQERRRGH